MKIVLAGYLTGIYNDLTDTGKPLGSRTDGPAA